MYDTMNAKLLHRLYDGLHFCKKEKETERERTKGIDRNPAAPETTPYENDFVGWARKSGLSMTVSPSSVGIRD